MHQFEIVLILVVLFLVVRNGRARGGPPWAGRHLAEASDARELRDEVRRLAERVQTLERVITDGRGGLDLEREIERLRDQ